MTEKQKEAILLINSLTGILKADEYFLLLEFIVANPIPIINVPFQQPYQPQPLDTWYKITCSDTATTDQTKEEE